LFFPSDQSRNLSNLDSMRSLNVTKMGFEFSIFPFFPFRPFDATKSGQSVAQVRFSAGPKAIEFWCAISIFRLFWVLEFFVIFRSLDLSLAEFFSKTKTIQRRTLAASLCSLCVSFSLLAGKLVQVEKLTRGEKRKGQIKQIEPFAHSSNCQQRARGENWVESKTGKTAV